MAINQSADLNVQEQKEKVVAEEYAPGELGPCIVTQKRIWKPADFQPGNPDNADPTLIQILTGLGDKCGNTTDEAARRFQVLQTWEQRHFDRGYQYLDAAPGGGWKVVGADAKNPQKVADDANLYPTNVFSAQGDIATGVLNRGKIKVSFSPVKKKEPMDVAAADAANKYVCLWQGANENLQRETADYCWTDSNVTLWTRSVADKRFGMSSDGKPAIREVTTAHGILEVKKPMMADTLQDCSFVQIFIENDYAQQRAIYPWMGTKIKPSWGVGGELEFERIARINTRIGIVGKYLTGTSGIREATMGYFFYRTGLYWDDSITPSQREFLLKNFPSGLFVIQAGPEFVCCWDASMEDHLTMGQVTRGFGQNRRALGSSDVPLQKRINIWADLWDKTVRGSIPMVGLHARAWNSEAIATLEANPVRFVPVEPDEGQTIQDTMAMTPQPTLIPGAAEMFQWYVGPLVQSIDGATPALFGQGEGEDNTVGATQIRLNQGLERFGPVWTMINRVYCDAAYQAAKLCSENSNEPELSGYGEDSTEIAVEVENLKGNFRARSETITAIPQSGAEREVKLIKLLDFASMNQQAAALIATPSNAREIVKGLHVDDILTVDEANSEDKALEDIQHLLDSEPLQNPQFEALTAQLQEHSMMHQQAQAQASDQVNQGIPLSEDQQSQGQAMEDQEQALQKQLEQTPQFLPSVPVAQDNSEDHATLAATVFAWMQEPEGRTLRRNALKEQEGGPNWKKWTNVFLYWKGHADMASQMAAQNQAPIPPRISINIPVDKLGGQAATSALAKAGIFTNVESGSNQMVPHEQIQEVTQQTPYGTVKQRTAIKRLGDRV